jgi:diguanylate cyclase (GGDEF)-like protein
LELELTKVKKSLDSETGFRERTLEPTRGLRGCWIRIPHAWTYAAFGMVLGVGAPAGALGLRALAGARLTTELRDNAFFYLYDLVGTCLVFAAVGFLAGRRADRLQSGRDSYRSLSELDSLTNLVNSRTFRLHYERAMEHAARFREPLSLLLIDVDQLKALNDEFGHSFGSAALLRVGKILESSKRASDMAARWGGDEFALLMPGAGAQAARRQAETILEQLRDEPIRVDGRERVISATIGVATSTVGSGGDLFEAADRALYAGKKAGRGQVRSAEA